MLGIMSPRAQELCHLGNLQRQRPHHSNEIHLDYVAADSSAHSCPLLDHFCRLSRQHFFQPETKALMSELFKIGVGSQDCTKRDFLQGWPELVKRRVPAIAEDAKTLPAARLGPSQTSLAELFHIENSSGGSHTRRFSKMYGCMQALPHQHPPQSWLSETSKEAETF